MLTIQQLIAETGMMKRFALTSPSLFRMSETPLKRRRRLKTLQLSLDSKTVPSASESL